MKISKLFHWLYALVMLLPIFAIGTTCLISTFNMSAKKETEIHYKYETNEVNSTYDLVIGNIYHFNLNSNSNRELTEYEYVSGIIINIDYFYCDSVESSLDEFNLSPLYLNSYNGMYLDIYFYNNGQNEIYLYTPTKDSYIATDVYYQFNSTYHFEFDIILDNFTLNTEVNTGDSIFNCFSICENIPIQSVETHNVIVEDVFYNAVNKVTESPLFSWSYNSFLVAPFSYIVALFGMPTNHVVVELLSYWLAISIIWLVFDLVMYVPLLVHRWLDKGVLE